MKPLKKIPFFLFLLVLFFCLHGSVENYGYLNVHEVVMVGILMFFAVVLLFGVFFLFTRNSILASLITFFISLWYFFFGALHDWIRCYAALSFMSSYSVLLPLLLLVTVLVFIFFKRKKETASRFFFYLNILLIIYCILDSALLLKKEFVQKKAIPNTVIFNDTKVTVKPNVYFLLFDEYAGYKSLRDSFAFANDSLYRFLHEKGFHILPLFSNYDFTPFSMSSILNMRYVDSGYNPQKINQSDLQMRINEISHAEVFSVFKKMGYHIQNYSVFDVGEMWGIGDKNSFLPVHSLLLTDKILHNRIIRTSGWLFQTGKFSLAIWRKKYLYQHETNNQYSQKMVVNSTNEAKAAPTFCYAHFMLPHWPFYRDSTGAYNSDEIIANGSLVNNKALYLSYLKYTNFVIESLVDSITGKDSVAIVIVMSDHGFRSYKNTATFEPFNFDNICAVRMPSGQHTVYKERWSAVNFFRYIFNAGYGQNIPYLNDSSIVLKHE